MRKKRNHILVYDISIEEGNYILAQTDIIRQKFSVLKINGQHIAGPCFRMVVDTESNCYILEFINLSYEAFEEILEIIKESINERRIKTV